jgi:hypothetical protein
LGKRRNYEILRQQLENERATFLQHWRDLSDFILPRRARFTVTDANKGDRRNQKIIDSTATLAARTLRSGMMSGVTSPARPWFRLTTSDPKLSELASVKGWLDEVTRLMSTTFLKSNLYNVLPTVYGDLGVFGSSAMFIEEDVDEVFRCYPFPIGSYFIANDSRLRVRVFMREFQMTVRQLIEKFGYDPGSDEIKWERFSTFVKGLYDQGLMEAWVEVTHIVKPNDDYNPNMLESKFKPFISCYYERGAGGMNASAYMNTDNEERILSEKGYDYFPVLCPRWEVTGEDSYGTECPGMQALGDIKALQLMQKRKSQAVEKSVNPPMVAPVSLKNQRSSIIAGDITYVDTVNDRGGFRPAHEVRPDIQGLLLDIQDHQNRIRRALFEDLFLMLAQSDRRNITAREIDERHEEKLLALGPVLEQLNQDLLDPLIDIAFDFMNKQGLIPEPPRELQAQPLKVEYISIMAQAQKMVGISSIERFLSVAQNMLAARPETGDKIDFDQAIDVYGDIMSIPTGIIRPDEEVEEIREARAEAQAQQAQMEQAQMASQAAKNFAQAPLGNNRGNALDQIVAASEEMAIS